MDVSSIPWDKPLGVVFAIALLAIFLDLTYRKIPRGFTRVRQELRRQTASLVAKQTDHSEQIKSLMISIERLDTAIAALLEREEEEDESRGQRRPRLNKKSTGPAGSTAKRGKGRPAR